jgi:drug/metabolite transporter (DMT)-like permease
MGLTPVYNAGWAWMGFDEPLRGYHLAGAALVVGGLANRPGSVTP